MLRQLIERLERVVDRCADAELAEHAPRRGVGRIKIGHVHRLVLEPHEHGGREGRPLAVAAAGEPARHVYILFRIVGPQAVPRGVIPPLVEMDLRVGEAVLVEQLPRLAAGIDKHLRLGRVDVKREEVERQFLVAAVGDERLRPVARHRRERGAAHLQLRIVGLDHPGHGLVEPEVILLRAEPHERQLHVGLVPDLPMGDAVVEAVGPAVVAVADDVHADPGEAVHVAGWMRVVLRPGLDAFPEPVDDL